MTSRIFLVDGTALAYRSFYAFLKNPLRNSRGENTSAVYGTVTALLDLLREHRPEYVAVVFDHPAPTFRHERFPDYKAKRTAMPEEMSASMPRVREAAKVLPLPVLEMAGVEADDIIGTLATRFAAEGDEAVIVSGDKDFCQLVTDRILILNPGRGGRSGVGESWMGIEEVKEKFGVEPSRVVDVLALMGDASDGVPGVPGVGEVTAKKLIREYGSLEALLHAAPHIPNPKLRARLLENEALARLSRELVTIDTGLDLGVSKEDLRVGPPGTPELLELFEECEFRRLLEEFRAKGGTRAAAPAVTPVALVRSEGDLAALRKALSGGAPVALDTCPPGAPGEPPAGVGLAVGDAVFYAPLAHASGANVDGAAFREAVRGALEDPAVGKLAHDAKAALLSLANLGLEPRGFVFDTLLAGYLLDPDARSSLEVQASVRLGVEVEPLASLLGTGASRKLPAEIPAEAAAPTIGRRAALLHRLAPVLREELRGKELLPLFTDVELPLAGVLARMEREGVRVDTAMLARLSEELERELGEIEAEIFRIAGAPFNVLSVKELQEVLFVRLKLPRKRRTKTGFSTDAEVLEELAGDFEIARLLLRHRLLAKIRSTYVDALPLLVRPSTGRIHTSYHQTVAATGRLSSSNPNLQNIPIRTPLGRRVREAFVAREPSFRLLSADYSQIELRIMAELSGDPALREAFRNGEDVHRRTAAEIARKPLDEVTAEERDRAKVVNYGVMYGMSAYGLARQLRIDASEAAAFIQAYYARHPGVSRYLARVLEEGKERGYVTTLLARRRYLPGLASKNPRERAEAERAAINTPIQGTAADMIKVAMVRIDRALAGERFRARMVLQVHDELVFDAPAGEIDRLEALVRGHMEKALSLSVPIEVDVRSGGSWAEIH